MYEHPTNCEQVAKSDQKCRKLRTNEHMFLQPTTTNTQLRLVMYKYNFSAYLLNVIDLLTYQHVFLYLKIELLAMGLKSRA